MCGRLQFPLPVMGNEQGPLPLRASRGVLVPPSFICERLSLRAPICVRFQGPHFTQSGALFSDQDLSDVPACSCTLLCDAK